MQARIKVAATRREKTPPGGVVRNGEICERARTIERRRITNQVGSGTSTSLLAPSTIASFGRLAAGFPSEPSRRHNAKAGQRWALKIRRLGWKRQDLDHEAVILAILTPLGRQEGEIHTRVVTRAVRSEPRAKKEGLTRQRTLSSAASFPHRLLRFCVANESHLDSRGPSPTLHRSSEFKFGSDLVVRIHSKSNEWILAKIRAWKCQICQPNFGLALRLSSPKMIDFHGNHGFDHAAEILGLPFCWINSVIPISLAYPRRGSSW